MFVARFHFYSNEHGYKFFFLHVVQRLLKNNYLYQGAFSELDADMGWTDFELRNYDAQIGGLHGDLQETDCR